MGTHTHGLNPTDADAEAATMSHYDLLGSVLGSYELAQESVQYDYNRYINGFAAKLTEDEAERIRGKKLFALFPWFLHDLFALFVFNVSLIGFQLLRMWSLCLKIGV